MSGDGALVDTKPPELPAGFPRPFGPYLLLSSYGRGGMGEVFLAQRTVSGLGAAGAGGMHEELCVLKTLRQDLCTDKSYVRRFLDEARIVVRLVHPNIAGVFDVGQAGDEYFMTMEHVAGTNLRELLATLVERDQELPEAVSLYIASEMLAALSYAHHTVDEQTGKALNVVHRDVSPHNVMISYDGAVKLIDFGLAQSALKQEQTESHVVMGKVAYMSPEQARGDDVDATCDQFAAAVATYECLVQDRYYGDLPTPKIWAVAGLGTFVPRRMSALHAELQGILKKALAADPRHRFASCADLRAAIDGYRKRRGLPMGREECAAIMHELFAERVERHRAIEAAFSNVPASSAGARNERTVNLHASRAGILAVPLTATMPVPRRERSAAHATHDGEHTALVDRSRPDHVLPGTARPSGAPVALAAAAFVAALVAVVAVVVTRGATQDAPVAVAPPPRVERVAPHVAEPPAPPVVETRPVVEAPPLVDAQPVVEAQRVVAPQPVVEPRPAERAPDVVAAAPKKSAKPKAVTTAPVEPPPPPNVVEVVEPAPPPKAEPLSFAATMERLRACQARNANRCAAPLVELGAKLDETAFRGTKRVAFDNCVQKCGG